MVWHASKTAVVGEGGYDGFHCNSLYLAYARHNNMFMMFNLQVGPTKLMYIHGTTGILYNYITNFQGPRSNYKWNVGYLISGRYFNKYS